LKKQGFECIIGKGEQKMKKIKSMMITKATAEVIRSVKSDLEQKDKPLKDLLNEEQDEHGSAGEQRSEDDSSQ
jgi:hypothetical protein